MSAKPKASLLPIRHPLVWCLRFWMWLFIICVSAGAGVSIGAFFSYLQKLSPIEKMENYNPAQQTRVYERSGENIIATYSQKREFVPQAKIPANLKNAFIAIEDERFYEHCGVDPKSMLRAVNSIFTKGKKQGGSTLTMQLARDSEIGFVSKKRTVGRKIEEMFAAVFIEQRYSKDQIIEFYLNQIFFGHWSYGVQAAAHTYFGKSIADLTVAECASLAAIPQTPSKVNPLDGPTSTTIRRNRVLDNMKRLSFIDEATYTRAKAEEMATVPRTSPTTEENPYFMSLVRSSLSFNPELKENILYHGGYQVFTTMNPAWQKILEEEVADGLKDVEKAWQEAKPGRLVWEQRNLMKKYGTTEPKKRQTRLARITEVREDGVMVELEKYKAFAPFRQSAGKYLKPWQNPEMVLKKGGLIDVYVADIDAAKRTIKLEVDSDARVQAAAVLLDVHTGNIVAISGGSDYKERDQMNRAISARRQPGSSFKPLLYSTAMQHGRTPGTLMKDEQPFEINGIKIKNYGDPPEMLGEAPLIRALAESDNVITVKLFQELGMKKSIAGYRKFDIIGAANKNKAWTLKEELSLCLGSLSVTPLSIAAAYLPFARANGTITEPTCISRITDLNNQSNIELPTPKRNIVLSPESAYLTTRMLREVVLSGSGHEVGEKFNQRKKEPDEKNPDRKEYPEIAGKTGTTNACVDAWFVGYTPDLVLAVWTGMDNNAPMGPKMSGSKISAPTWCAIMQRVLETRTDWKMKFDVPNNVVFRNISKEDGLLLDGGEDTLEDVPFVKGTEPTAKSSGGHTGASPSNPDATDSNEDGESYETTTPGSAASNLLVPSM